MTRKPVLNMIGSLAELSAKSAWCGSTLTSHSVCHLPCEGGYKYQVCVKLSKHRRQVGVIISSVKSSNETVPRREVSKAGVNISSIKCGDMIGTFYTMHGHCPENTEAFLNDRV